MFWLNNFYYFNKSSLNDIFYSLNLRAPDSIPVSSANDYSHFLHPKPFHFGLYTSSRTSFSFGLISTNLLINGRACLATLKNSGLGIPVHYYE